MHKSQLKKGYSIYGNKGNVWNNNAHIYQSGVGNLCGTPALATNWAGIEGIENALCKDCIKEYNNLNK